MAKASKRRELIEKIKPGQLWRRCPPSTSWASSPYFPLHIEGRLRDRICAGDVVMIVSCEKFQPDDHILVHRYNMTLVHNGTVYEEFIVANVSWYSEMERVG